MRHDRCTSPRTAATEPGCCGAVAVHWYHDPADPVRTLIGRCGKHGLPSALLSKTMGGLVGELTEAEVSALEVHAA